MRTWELPPQSMPVNWPSFPISSSDREHPCCAQDKRRTGHRNRSPASRLLAGPTPRCRAAGLISTSSQLSKSHSLDPLPEDRGVRCGSLPTVSSGLCLGSEWRFRGPGFAPNGSSANYDEDDNYIKVANNGASQVAWW